MSPCHISHKIGIVRESEYCHPIGANRLQRATRIMRTITSSPRDSKCSESSGFMRILIIHTFWGFMKFSCDCGSFFFYYFFCNSNLVSFWFAPFIRNPLPGLQKWIFQTHSAWIVFFHHNALDEWIIFIFHLNSKHRPWLVIHGRTLEASSGKELFCGGAA